LHRFCQIIAVNGVDLSNLDEVRIESGEEFNIIEVEIISILIVYDKSDACILYPDKR
jgi:hypothetical protein